MKCKLFRDCVEGGPLWKYNPQSAVYALQETPVGAHQDTDVMPNQRRTSGFHCIFQLSAYKGIVRFWNRGNDCGCNISITLKSPLQGVLSAMA